ncbi:MAG: hypothetical protein AAF363_07525 [Bacteroidota bacterium]
MSSFRIRPRFKHLIKGNKEQVEEQLYSALKSDSQFITNYLPGHIYIKINPAHQHFWSPQLHLSFEQESEDVIVRGLYGPNPTMWAVFFMSYVALGISSMFLGMWGLTRWNLGLDASVLWIIPVLGVCALILYVAGQTGQKIGAQQMFDIHHAYESLTGNKVIIN